MSDKEKELSSILIQLLHGLELSKVRIMLTMAVITAYQLQQTMADWVADYYEREGIMTTRIFMSKLNELTDSDF